MALVHSTSMRCNLKYHYTQKPSAVMHTRTTAPIYERWRRIPLVTATIVKIVSNIIAPFSHRT